MTAGQLKEAVKAFAEERGLDLVGFVSTAHLDEVTPTQFKPARLWPAARTAISIGQRFLLGAVDVGTGDMIQNARWVAWRTNEMLNRRAMEIGHFLERKGARALPLANGTMVDPDWTNQGIFGDLSHRHVAAEAGLGVIGVPTFLVTPQFGPRVYLNTILTDAELEPDPRLDFDPCIGCDECVKACPNEAIVRGRRTIRKGRCIPLAMPHGVTALQSYVQSMIDAPDQEAAVKRLREFDFARHFRAQVQGVGTIAGCFHCLAACPVGRQGVAISSRVPWADGGATSVSPRGREGRTTKTQRHKEEGTQTPEEASRSGFSPAPAGVPSLMLFGVEPPSPVKSSSSKRVPVSQHRSPRITSRGATSGGTFAIGSRPLGEEGVPSGPARGLRERLRRRYRRGARYGIRGLGRPATSASGGRAASLLLRNPVANGLPEGCPPPSCFGAVGLQKLIAPPGGTTS